MSELITLSAFAFRRNGQSILTNVSLTIRQSESWAIVGPTGSGKTTLLQALAGQLPGSAMPTQRRVKTAFVSFKEESSRFSYSNFFYQQRYQATMGDDPYTNDPSYTSIPTVRTYLQVADHPESIALIERLGLTPLLERSFIKLSNGQTRKVRIGKALLQQPAVLIIDNPFVGLDSTFRQELIQWLSQLTKDGLTIILVTEPKELPSFITHVAELAKGQLQSAGPKEAYRPQPVNETRAVVPVLVKKSIDTNFVEAFRLQDVTVRYGETIILNQLSWVVRAGERWALVGPNGAGKSVLLGLLYGDHPQAYANEIYVFGHRRGKSGESVWDVKRRIGFVSPELHLYYPSGLTARQVALTGLTDTLTPPSKVAGETETDLTNLLTYFGIIHVLNRSFGTLSTGEQRLVLLVRAFLKNAPVLLLDEPFQAIDESRVQLARQLIDSLSGKTILFITHDKRELPMSVDKCYTIGINNP